MHAYYNLECKWTPETFDDRRTIYAYIEANNPGAALDLDEPLSEKAARLVDHFGQGHPPP